MLPERDEGASEESGICNNINKRKALDKIIIFKPFSCLVKDAALII